MEGRRTAERVVAGNVRLVALDGCECALDFSLGSAKPFRTIPPTSRRALKACAIQRDVRLL